MSDSSVITAVNLRLYDLRSLQKRLEDYLSKQGTYCLASSIIRGKKKFYAVSKVKKKKIYLGKDRESDLSKLSVKLYKENLLKATKEEIKVLEGVLKQYNELEDNKIEDVYSLLPAELKKHVIPDSFTDEGFARLWSEQSFTQAKRTDSHKFKINDKAIVRSKSEFMIAELLEKNGIPYRYEELLVLNPAMRLFYFPDFTILNKRTRKIIYWEHLGKLGDEDYCKDNIQKLEDYADYGILQGRNLILTYECSGKPLTTKTIETLIKELLV